jgi:hypothetical protein
MTGEVPNPLYLSFAIGDLTLGDMLLLFGPYMGAAALVSSAMPQARKLVPWAGSATQPVQQASSILTSALDALNLVQAKNVSFHWCGDAGVVLPDGTLASPGFGFGGAIEILGWTGLAAFELGATGISGVAAMSPINLPGVLMIGDDSNGVLLPPSAPASRQPATVAGLGSLSLTHSGPLAGQGGPVLAFSSTTSPFLHGSAKVKLFGSVSAAANMTISATGFSFAISVALGGAANGALNCVLAGPTHFTASGNVRITIDGTVGPITVNNVHVGSITLKRLDVRTALGVSLDPQTFSMKFAGQFKFEEASLTVPAFALSAPPASFAALPVYMLEQIQKFADHIFVPLLGNVEKWANLVGRGVVTGVTDVAGTLQKAYHVTAQDAARLMKGAGFSFSDDQVKGLGGDFAKSFGDVGHAAKDAGRKIKNTGRKIKNTGRKIKKGLPHL